LSQQKKTSSIDPHEVLTYRPGGAPEALPIHSMDMCLGCIAFIPPSLKNNDC